ncbi:2-keto-4-pentenoate hydratase/2-oxohepta-3-ene-1,7-dioic acid hydratase in catechol pathway [Kribbella sp. VKM Ac-2571]|uniref:fumarylacetoacetate hydrolase family protein n=1 Tax=Kribbella sp. VKM Ac-2571 TaxID=2512222 RepID=UPI00105E3F1D|nr:fumarylacetoacetate hydrolase family protein [Kribbella sp. VKM Ac-2571]TDO54181.1 2-keto-4-pentenoate hydratase/2-oxohepta-3-ene-1,7-dioic acid hydratase in catechol pathway [Kribbella sp. VKM Ac-2571]
MRIARFSVDDEPKYGVVETDDPEGLVGTVNVLDSDPLYRSAQFTGEKLQLADVRLLAPVIPRSKVVCVGRNYAAHAAELGNDVPTAPLIFLKPNTSVIGPRDGIVYPEQTNDLHFEGELAIVIGRICRDLPKERVNEVIFGYTVANDVTARDLQKSDGQWARAKGFDTFCPLGPWISTELDVSDLRVSTELNGEPKQDGRTSEFIFDIPEVLAYITSFTTLLPGDVVLTGTPAGVGPMLPGDEVSVSIEGIGTLTNKVIVRD